MVSLLEINKNRIKNLLLLFVIASSLFVLIIISPDCLFRQWFHIPCPSCGMTRAFYAILTGDLISAFFYNILAIPLLFLFLFVVTWIIRDILFNQDTFMKGIFPLLGRYYLFILTALVTSFLINLYHYSIFVI